MREGTANESGLYRYVAPTMAVRLSEAERLSGGEMKVEMCEMGK